MSHREELPPPPWSTTVHQSLRVLLQVPFVSWPGLCWSFGRNCHLLPFTAIPNALNKAPPSTTSTTTPFEGILGPRSCCIPLLQGFRCISASSHTRILPLEIVLPIGGTSSISSCSTSKSSNTSNRLVALLSAAEKSASEALESQMKVDIMVDVVAMVFVDCCPVFLSSSFPVSLYSSQHSSPLSNPALSFPHFSP